ncbi:MAG: universal stress protein [Actinomycetota bacterium]|nr:universal stress protein [Actinomycetota bacterium]
MSAGLTNGAPRIVVGVDGSPSSRTALRWAVRQANLTNGTVDAVMAWEIPMVLQSYGFAPIYVEEDGSFEENAKKTIEAVISEETEPTDSQRVRSLVIKGHPAQVLLDAAAGADLLVVGSRGHGQFADALLGSVSQNCVHHAPCPVLILRGEGGQAGPVTSSLA